MSSSDRIGRFEFVHAAYIASTKLKLRRRRRRHRLAIVEQANSDDPPLRAPQVLRAPQIPEAAQVEIEDQPPLSFLSKRRSEIEDWDETIVVTLVVVRLNAIDEPDLLTRKLTGEMHPEGLAVDILPFFNFVASDDTLLENVDHFLEEIMGLSTSKVYELNPVQTKPARRARDDELHLRYLVTVVNPEVLLKESASSEYERAQWIGSGDAQSVEGSGEIADVFYKLFESARTGRADAGRLFNLVEQLRMVKFGVMSAMDAEIEDDEREPTGRVRYSDVPAE